MHLIRPATALALLASLSACSTAPGPIDTAPAAPHGSSVPDYLEAPAGCALVAGGGIGSRFSDKQVMATWDKINSAVTTELHDRLLRDRYKVFHFLVPTERTRKAEELVFDNLAARRCNRLLQVSHKVDEDASGKYFRFDIALFRIVPKQDAHAPATSVTVVTAGEFQRAYRYPRTQESFDNFYTGDFAEKVLADLAKSGALATLR